MSEDFPGPDYCPGLEHLGPPPPGGGGGGTLWLCLLCRVTPGKSFYRQDLRPRSRSSVTLRDQVYIVFTHFFGGCKRGNV